VFTAVVQPSSTQPAISLFRNFAIHTAGRVNSNCLPAISTLFRAAGVKVLGIHSIHVQLIWQNFTLPDTMLHRLQQLTL